MSTERLEAAQPVSVVVVTYNSAAVVGNLLHSLDEGLRGVEHWELLVVDNASADDTVAVVERAAPQARVVAMGRNAGYAAAINAGIAASSLDGALLVLNPDVRLRPGCAAVLLDALRSPGVGIAVPALRDERDRISLSLRRDPSITSAWSESILGGARAGRRGWGEVVTPASAYLTAGDVDWATGAVLAVSAECRRAVGSWDESFFLYSEEVDYCQRARAAGFAVRYRPDAVAEHVGGPYGSDPALWGLLVGNRVRHFARHHGAVPTAAFRAGVALGEALRVPVRPSARTGLRAALRAVPDDAAGFIWFAAQDWWYHNQAHSDFQLMQQVARTRPVLVVNSLGLRVPRKGTSTRPWRRILRKVRSTAKFVRRPVEANPGFHVMTPIILPFYGDSAGARLSAWLVRQQVRLVARAIGIGRAPAIGATIPTAWPVVAPMRRSALLYNRADLHSAFPEADGTWVLSLENALLEHADRVLYVSHELMRLDAPAVGPRAFFLDHGVDLEHFRDEGAPVAPELAAIPRPIVGFFGGLDDYVVDMDLLRVTAERLPEASLVLIGDATCSMAELTALPNVYWLGFRPYEQIPALGRGFDVGIMPWLDNEWIRFANPIKLKEYLALGLPVVTTEYPEVDDYRTQIAVARSREEFPELVRATLAHPGDAGARSRSVLAFSWQERALALLGLVDDVRSR